MEEEKLKATQEWYKHQILQEKRHWEKCFLVRHPKSLQPQSPHLFLPPLIPKQQLTMHKEGRKQQIWSVPISLRTYSCSHSPSKIIKLSCSWSNKHSKVYFFSSQTEFLAANSKAYKRTENRFKTRMFSGDGRHWTIDPKESHFAMQLC